MGSEKHSFGKIITDRADYDKNKIVRIVGIPDVCPNFINRIDENLWFNYWNDKSQSLNVDYVHEQNMFYKNNSKIYWPNEEVNKVTEDITSLIKAYCKSAKLYNQTIAESFVKERKNLLDKIF